MSEIDSIIKGMKKAGFPLEVIAGTRFTNRGWTVRQQVFFHDRDENKSRYVDIVAHNAVDKETQKFKRLNYTVVAECKKSDKAWVFYTPPSPFLVKEKDLATVFYLQTTSNPPLQPRDLRFLSHNHYVSEEPLDRLALASYIAFSKDEESKGRDGIFAATNQVLKALQYTMEQFRTQVAYPNLPPILIVAYLVIVFDGKMYEYHLDEKEEPKLTETQYVK
ncbi:MAG: hypothetical protein ACHQ03_07785 [Candidatus Bathyarchaeia archaeon]